MLRPTLFKILSTTQLKIGFNLPLSTNLDIDNFKIESISGNNNPFLEILSIKIEKNEVVLTTRPHYAKAYYVLKLLDSVRNDFISDKGIALINDDVSRDIYFIGVDKINPIRDDLLFKTPSIYNTDNTLVSSILDIQSNQLLSAQHMIGSVLNDNYISELVENEYRIRSSGATDRLSNENAYKIESVSIFPSGTNIKNKKIEVDSTNIYPINLKQEFVELLSINNDSTSSSFNGFLISVPNKNVIKVTYIKLIKESDTEDCDGNIGTIYDINKFKYSLKNNRYDQENSFSNFELESNQILISEFGNLLRPESNDTIIISYYYENNSISIIESSIEVYEINDVTNESIPSNSKLFTLKNSNIVDSLDNIPEINGIVFKESENSDVIPYQFSKEIKYNFSSLPKNTGEFSVNYETGDIYVVGERVGEGTGYNYFFANYKFKNIYKNELDYNVYNSELNLNYLRQVFGKNIKISFDYEDVFSEGIDYVPMVHKEELGEFVENKVTSSFSLKTNYGPITDVFRIYNQTTGEIYALNYFFDNEIYFTGNKLPTTSEVLSESSNFEKINGEELIPSGTLLSPIHYGNITSNVTTNNIQFYPGIPAELINSSNTNYFIRFLDLDLDDYKIISFYTPDSNNIISGFSIQSGLTLPNIGTRIQIGTTVYLFNLKNNKIINKSNDGIGSVLNSSVSFDSDYFVNEKFFYPVSKNNEISISNTGSQTYTVSEDQAGILNKNISRLRIFGDYCLDYNNGVLYLASQFKENFGNIFYIHASHVAQYNNIISVSGLYKKLIPSDSSDLSQKAYDNAFTKDKITVANLETTTNIYEGLTRTNEDGTIEDVLLVKEDFTINVDYKIKNINSINKNEDLLGNNLDSIFISDRVPESSKNDLLLPFNFGGKNYYSKESISYYDNVIDLKSYSKSKVKIIDENYQINVKTNNILSIYSVNTKLNYEILNQDLNLIIQDNLTINNIEYYDSASYLLDLENISSEYTFNEGFDYIISGSNRWKIISFDGVNSILVNKYSENYNEIFNEQIVSLAIRPTVIYGLETKIIYPINSFMSEGELVSVSFITENSLMPGQAVAVDYSYGDLFFDYIYLNDIIKVYYEYGDNEIDWSINNSIPEGQGYYITYRYGALRSALRRNFGRLTGIPFFDNQSYSIDREFYRDAIQGVLSAYPKGPTKDAINGLVKSVVKTNPTIEEFAFGSWVLGRDYLSPGEIKYSGILNFTDGKFGSGLKINNDNSIFMPAISNLPLDEGTFEAWIIPDWYGINNDATLTFEFDNIGEKKLHYIGGDPFSSKYGYDVINQDFLPDDSGFDHTGGKVTIYKSGNIDGYSSIDYSSLFGIFNKKISLNRETKISSEFEFLFNYSYLPPISDSFSKLIESGFFNSGAFLSDFDHKTFELYTCLETYKNENITVVYSDIESSKDNLLNFNPPYPTVGCSCYYPNQNNILENFNKLEIEIKLDTPINYFELFDINNTLDSSPESLMIVDQSGRFYQVTGFRNNIGEKITSDLNLIDGFFVSRFPINMPSLSAKSADEINSIQIFNFIILKKQIQLKLKEDSKSKEFFNNNYKWTTNWSKKQKIKYFIDPILNLSYIRINSFEYSFFYTDLEETNLINNFNSNSMSKSIGIGVFGISSLNLYKNIVNIIFKFNLNDIYIGLAGIHPNKTKFSLNRLSSDLNSSGISNFINIRDGVYIGYDSACLSPINENIGQWLLKFRGTKYSNLPYDVGISEEGFFNLSEYVFIDNNIAGRITTDGQYSSIAHSRKLISQNCEYESSYSKHFKFLGNKKLDIDGWSIVQNSDSELIDLINDGREAESIVWNKLGLFNTSNTSGIYRVENITNSYNNQVSLSALSGNLYGNIDYKISLKISNFNEEIFNYSKYQNLKSSGIIVAKIKTSNCELGILLSADQNKVLMISLVNLENLNIKSSVYFNWNNNDFNQYNLLIDMETNIVSVSVNGTILIQSDLEYFIYNQDECLDVSSFGVSLILFSDLFNNSEDITVIQNLIVDISNIDMQSSYNPGLDSLENDDFLIVSDKTIDFELHANPKEELIDGYTQEYDIDEIMITSDLNRYILDTAKDDSNSRFSIFKDGKGFLNFRIIDDSNSNKTFYNLATNIRNFLPGEMHHIAASWKLNSDIEKDEMHLFVDGQEAANLFKFGGSVPTAINTKFSDISKEFLQNYVIKKIIFPELLNDGEIIAGSNILYSSSIFNYDNLIGRTLIFDELSEPTSGALIILEVGDGWISLGNIDTLEPYLFLSSGTNIEFRLAPYSENILTDIKNERFSIFKKDCFNNEEELGGLEYSIYNEDILINNDPLYYGYRFNKNSKIIEFVKKDSDCKYKPSVNISDIEIHIKTFGLTTRRCFDIISVSGSSLYYDDPVEILGLPTNRNGYSIFMTSGPKPKDLTDVSLRKYILYNHSILEDFITSDSFANFTINLSESYISSFSIESAKNNDGRYIEISIDSDNIFYNADNKIKISGETSSGYAEEIILINKNGKYYTSNRYKNILEISGQLKIIDTDSQFIGILNIIEKNSIFVQDGSGTFAKIHRFSNGYFVISSSDFENYYPFELNPGYYELDYSAYLKINLPEVGKNIYIGSDFKENNQLLGKIDEVIILNTMLSDLKGWEKSNSLTRTITEDFFKNTPSCITNSTLVLIDFENPTNKQSRRLRNKKYLSPDNYIYSLSINQRENLIKYINDERNFVLEMISMGFSEYEAKETYIECHKAYGSPLVNLAKFIPTYNNFKLNENSVNTFFNQAVRFGNKSAITLSNNNNILRNSGGNIEFWYRTSLDSFNDNSKRTFFESCSIQTERVKSISPWLLKISNSASKILSIKLLSSSKFNDSRYYSNDEYNQIIFDEIILKETTGRYSDGTGVEKDFSMGSSLSYDGKSINLSDSLPGSNVDVLITYIPKQLSDERIEIFKDEYSRIIAKVDDKNYSYYLPAEINWSENSWHRITFSYSFLSNKSFMKLFVDGKLYSTIYKKEKNEKAITYNNNEIISILNIKLTEQSSIITIGNNFLLNSPASGLIDNFRISRIPREYPVGSDGSEYDLNYSSNLNAISPVQSDDITTYIQSFDKLSINSEIYTSSLIDPKYGIFDFEIKILDDFSRVVGIDDGKLEDILTDLILRIKPAHSNGYVKYVEKKCIQ